MLAAETGVIQSSVEHILYVFLTDPRMTPSASCATLLRNLGLRRYPQSSALPGCATSRLGPCRERQQDFQLYNEVERIASELFRRLGSPWCYADARLVFFAGMAAGARRSAAGRDRAVRSGAGGG